MLINYDYISALEAVVKCRLTHTCDWINVPNCNCKLHIVKIINYNA